jgi:hypothetical protein
MKKILTLFAVVGLFAFSGCSNDDNDVDNDTIPQAFEISNVNLGRVADNEYNLKSTFQFEIGGPLYDDETILVYRLTGTLNPTTPVWQLIPRTIYLDNGNELDYDFDFSKIDFIITARGTYNLLNTPNLINNQTFRVVIVPSVLASTLKTDNYLDVMKTLKLNESEIKKVNL